jgi:hypothetical protein
MNEHSLRTENWELRTDRSIKGEFSILPLP